MTGRGGGPKAFLALLFGDVDCDGRGQRLLEAVRPLGNCDVLDSENGVLRPWSDGMTAPPRPAGGRRRLIRHPFARHLFFWIAALRTALGRRPRAVIGCDYFAAWPAWLAARLTGAPLVYDAHELFIPEADRPMNGRDRFWYRLEKCVVRRAALVIAANGDRARLMQEHYGLRDAPTVMRNIPPERSGDGHGVEAGRKYPVLARRRTDERLILYQGNLSLGRGLERIIAALDHLPENYRFVIAGDGMDLPRLAAAGARFAAQGRFAALGRVENRLLTAMAGFADVGIIMYPYQGLNNVYCAPNKLFEYAQAGLPVAASDQPPLSSAIAACGIGETFGAAAPPQQVAQVLMRVAENKGEYQARIPGFLAANRWQDEAERARAAVGAVLG